MIFNFNRLINKQKSWSENLIMITKLREEGANPRIRDPLFLVEMGQTWKEEIEFSDGEI